MSDEEAKIRGELEMDIESDLEGEIKGEMYRLALRLHRLYQHQKDKRTPSTSLNTSTLKQVLSKQKHKNKNVKELSEVNISIKMEGGTKVEIKEIKKPADEILDRIRGHGHIRIDNHNNNNKRSSKYGNKRFDWANSLRSGPPKSCHLMVHSNNNQSGKEDPRTPRQSKEIKPVLSKAPKLAWR